jgi:hypothetical protein
MQTAPVTSSSIFVLVLEAVIKTVAFLTLITPILVPLINAQLTGRKQKAFQILTSRGQMIVGFLMSVANDLKNQNKPGEWTEAVGAQLKAQATAWMKEQSQKELSIFLGALSHNPTNVDDFLDKLIEAQVQAAKGNTVAAGAQSPVAVTPGAIERGDHP